MDILAGLNADQKEAAQQCDGPVLILAGAGSGKTKALVHRVAYIIEHMPVQAYNILAITFTNKAANEIKSRVRTILSKANGGVIEYEPMIGTFHSTALQWLKVHADKIGYESSFSILDSSDQLAVVKDVMKKRGIDTKTYTPKSVLHAISSAKNELLSPEGYTSTAFDARQEVVAQVYIGYQRALQEGNMMDFDDLLLNCVKLFREHKDVLEKYQERYRYIMVDEYQDTNQAQYEIVTMLADKYKNICVIGDDWQGIYSWRGATIQNILDFENHYPDCKVIKLEQNYRSTKTILAAAQSVIDNNEDRTEKTLWTDNGQGELLEMMVVNDQSREAVAIVDDIERTLQDDRLDKGELNYSDFAVLYRVNAQSRALEEAFVNRGIPYKLIGGVSFYERKEIKDVLAYLRLIHNPRDMVSFMRIVNTPARKLGKKALETFQAYVDTNRLSLRDAIENAHLCTDLSAIAHNSFANFNLMIRQLRQLNEESNASAVLAEMLKPTGYMTYVMDGTDEGFERAENIKELQTVAAKYDNLPGGESLGVFLDEVALIADQDGVISDGSAVNLLTIHSSKGLEFDYVYLPGMEESIFPHQRSFLDTKGMEEERRLCYVALTRARKKVMLLAADSRMFFGDVQRNAISRFLEEIPQELFRDFNPGAHKEQAAVPKTGLEAFKDQWRTKQDNRMNSLKSRMQYSQNNASTFSDFEERDDSFDGIDLEFEAPVKEEERSTDLSGFNKGDKIQHEYFGDGIVMEIDGTMVTVLFGALHGQKKLDASLVNLKKL